MTFLDDLIAAIQLKSAKPTMVHHIGPGTHRHLGLRIEQDGIEINIGLADPDEFLRDLQAAIAEEKTK